MNWRLSGYNCRLLKNYEPQPKVWVSHRSITLFPGAELSSLKRHLKAFKQAGLQIVHHSVHDYRPTLAVWFNRLAENQEAAVQLVGIPTYNQYLCYLAEAWRSRPIADAVCPAAAGWSHPLRRWFQGMFKLQTLPDLPPKSHNWGFRRQVQSIYTFQTSAQPGKSQGRWSRSPDALSGFCILVF